MRQLRALTPLLGWRGGNCGALLECLGATPQHHLPLPLPLPLPQLPRQGLGSATQYDAQEELALQPSFTDAAPQKGHCGDPSRNLHSASGLGLPLSSPCIRDRRDSGNVAVGILDQKKLEGENVGKGGKALKWEKADEGADNQRQRQKQRRGSRAGGERMSSAERERANWERGNDTEWDNVEARRHSSWVMYAERPSVGVGSGFGCSQGGFLWERECSWDHSHSDPTWEHAIPDSTPTQDLHTHVFMSMQFPPRESVSGSNIEGTGSGFGRDRHQTLPWGLVRDQHRMGFRMMGFGTMAPDYGAVRSLERSSSLASASEELKVYPGYHARCTGRVQGRMLLSQIGGSRCYPGDGTHGSRCHSSSSGSHSLLCVKPSRGFQTGAETQGETQTKAEAETEVGARSEETGTADWAAGAGRVEESSTRLVDELGLTPPEVGGVGMATSPRVESELAKEQFSEEDKRIEEDTELDDDKEWLPRRKGEEEQEMESLGSLDSLDSLGSLVGQERDELRLRQQQRRQRASPLEGGEEEQGEEKEGQEEGARRGIIGMPYSLMGVGGGVISGTPLWGNAGQGFSEGAPVPEISEQRFLRVGLVGAPNAGKSSLCNSLVYAKVAAVSRKTNTTRRGISGIFTEGNTQLVVQDTPGLVQGLPSAPLSSEARTAVAHAWAATDTCHVLALVIDADRQIRMPDARVQRLAHRLGTRVTPAQGPRERREDGTEEEEPEEQQQQRRIVVLNKVDLVKDKRELLPLAAQLGQLPAFERTFMVSARQGGKGVDQLRTFLQECAVETPWEEDPSQRTDQSVEELAMQMVREALLDKLHQELPYEVDQQHVGTSVLRDGSLRVEQRLLVNTVGQRGILLGTKGANIRNIGVHARKHVEHALGRTVHLVLNVKVAKR